MSRNGGIRWHKQWVNVSQTLGEESVGLVEIDDGEWDGLLRPAPLGPIPRAHPAHRGCARPALPPALLTTVTDVLGLNCHPCPGLFRPARC